MNPVSPPVCKHQVSSERNPIPVFGWPLISPITPVSLSPDPTSFPQDLPLRGHMQRSYPLNATMSSDTALWPEVQLGGGWWGLQSSQKTRFRSLMGSPLQLLLEFPELPTMPLPKGAAYYKPGWGPQCP